MWAIFLFEKLGTDSVNDADSGDMQLFKSSAVQSPVSYTDGGGRGSDQDADKLIILYICS